MKPEILMVHVLKHAERLLLAANKPTGPEELEQQGRWMFSLYHAQNFHDLTHKEMAELMMDGSLSTGSVHEECVGFCDPDEELDMSADILDYFSEL